MDRIANASFIRNFKSLLFSLLFVYVLRYIYMYISVEIRGQPVLPLGAITGLT